MASTQNKIYSWNLHLTPLIKAIQLEDSKLSNEPSCIFFLHRKISQSNCCLLFYRRKCYRLLDCKAKKHEFERCIQNPIQWGHSHRGFCRKNSFLSFENAYAENVLENFRFNDLDLKVLNKSGHKECRHRLGMGGTNVPPPISKYFSEIFLQTI